MVELVGWGTAGALLLRLALPVAGLMALAADRLVFRSLRRRRAAPVILAMASLALALLVRSMVLIGWGPGYTFYTQGLRTVYILPCWGRGSAPTSSSS